MKWTYNKPEFECDKLNYDLLKYSPWSGHRSFVYDYMACFKPKTIAELGSHYGGSAFTFCQADKDFEINCEMFFVDTWQGDDFTKKYDNDVYTIFRKTLDDFYSSQRANMVRTTFDEAVSQFEDNYFDLIHIDGSHHYDDVKGDFEKWLPKAKKDGVIMLHDISEDIVLGDVMGSHKFWLELKEKYDFTIDFDFSWGLGVIFLDKEKYDFITKNVELSKYQRNNNALDVEFKDVLRQNHFTLLDKQAYIDDLLNQKEILSSHISSYKENEEKKELYINELKEDKKILEASLEENKQLWEKTQKETIEAYEKTQREMNEEFEKSKKEIAESYEKTKAEMNEEFEKNLQNVEDAYLKTQQETIEAYEKTIEDYKNTVNNLENTVEDNKKTFAAYEENVKGKDSYINELEERTKALEEEKAYLTSEVNSLTEKYSKTLRYKLSKLFKK